MLTQSFPGLNSMSRPSGSYGLAANKRQLLPARALLLHPNLPTMNTRSEASLQP